MLVTLVGYDIMRGRALLTPTGASDFAHLLAACLFHDIGFVRGILKGDSSDRYIIDAKGSKTELERGSSDAALMPYHVDRSKLFVIEHITVSISMLTELRAPSNLLAFRPSKCPKRATKRGCWCERLI
jgi:hypothetical protein